MFKIIGMCGVLSASVMTGFSLAKELKRKIELLKEVHQSAIHIKSDLEYRAPSLEECFKERGALFSKAYHYISINSCLPGEALIKACKEIEILNSEEKNVIFSFAENLSKEDLESLVASISLFINEIECIINRAETEYASKGRLYRSGGVLLGMGIVILLM